MSNADKLFFTIPVSLRQRLALFAAENGREWRSRLQRVWQTSSENEHWGSGLLRQLRNNYADTLFTQTMREDTRRLFKITWAAGQPTLHNRVEYIFELDICVERGYSQDFVDYIRGMTVGDTERYNDNAGEIFIERLL